MQHLPQDLPGEVKKNFDAGKEDLHDPALLIGLIGPTCPIGRI